MLGSKQLLCAKPFSEKVLSCFGAASRSAMVIVCNILYKCIFNCGDIGFGVSVPKAACSFYYRALLCTPSVLSMNSFILLPNCGFFALSTPLLSSSSDSM